MLRTLRNLFNRMSAKSQQLSNKAWLACYCHPETNGERCAQFQKKLKQLKIAETHGHSIVFNMPVTRV